MRMKQLLSIYVRARKYLADPNNWTQQKFQEGHQVCLIGSLELIAGREVREDAQVLLPLALSIKGEATVLRRAAKEAWYMRVPENIGEQLGDFIASYNDNENRRHYQVIATLSRAIERIKADMEKARKKRLSSRIDKQVKQIISNASSAEPTKAAEYVE